MWLCEVLRHLERMEQARSRVFVVSLFGGVGTMSALPRGPETLKGVARRLGLAPAPVSWHTARDTIAEYVTVLAMISSTLGKVSSELYALAKTEFGEVAEAHSPGKVGSSTMPHKRNPETFEQVAMLGRLTKYQAALALEGMVVEHDRDGRAWRTEWVSVPEVTCYTAAAVRLSREILEGVEVRPQRMAENLRLEKDFLFSEALMIHLAAALGKQTAHEVVYAAAMEAHEKGSAIIERLLERPEVASRFDRAALEEVTEPSRQVGGAVALTDEALRLARGALGET